MLKKIDNIYLIGTSHVAKQSVEEIKKCVNDLSPEVVAIELDYNRLKTLISDDKDPKKEKKSTLDLVRLYGVGGYLFVYFASKVQQSVGKSLGIEPGIDMKTAYFSAREKKIPTALIDLDIRSTVRKISRMSFMDKISNMFKLFFSGFKKDYRKKLNFDPRKGVPDEKFINVALDIVKKETPKLYDILIEDRNKHMVNKILNLKENHSGPILVVVGAGHLKGMYQLLSDRLNYGDVSFSFTID